MEFNLSRIPSSAEMFGRFHSETWSFAVLILAAILTIFTVCLYIEELVFLHRRFEFGSRRGYLIYICGVFPVHSVTSFMGLCVPTATFTCNFLADLYIAIALYILLLLMTDLFGGLDEMVRALSETAIPLRQPPCCCFLFCLPSVKLNKKMFHRIRVGVLQYIIVLQFVALYPALMWVDQLMLPSQSSKIYSTIEIPATVINVMSTLTAVYSVVLLFRASRAPLRSFQLSGQFVSVQLVLVSVNFQRVALTVLIRLNVVECIRPLHCNADLVLKTLLNLLIVFEMPLIMLGNRITIQRWIRSGTNTQCFQPDVKADAEGGKHICLPDSENNHNDGAFDNKAISGTDPDLSTLV
ncbi:organic solute transporter subunit alpha-like isoform X2 [Patiria miniata]|uniref:Uncharacterized protein n=1 Tax=Patiria miniata TaxID=46514 RepID=A0A914A6B5_PATMI|nr:organic solute transporter subunit alpha-like isoform X2 [Patiria miniata]